MSSMTFSQKSFQTVPPAKGSFPLDHNGECKLPMMKYMKCLANKKDSQQKCRQQSMDYLECRMDRSLMLREPWKKLGFTDPEITEFNKRITET